MAIWTFGVNFVARTEAFMRDTAKVRQSLDQVSSQTKNFGKSMQTLTRIGGIGWLAKSFMDSATAMSKARREGEGLIGALLSGVPIVNRFAESFKAMAGEISGMTPFKEAMEAQIKWIEKSESLKQKLTESIALRGATPEEAVRLEAGFDYLRNIQGINALREHIHEVNKEILDLDRNIAGLEKQKAVAAFPSVAQKKIDELVARRATLGDPVNAAELYALNERNYQEQLKQNKAFYDTEKERARDYIAFIRSQDDMTRQERIENLRAYQAENAETLTKVAEANKALNDEILNLERSRSNAIKVYNAEMRERLQDPYKTAMEYAADFTRYSETEWKNFWNPVIDGSKSANEAINDFVRNSLIKFAQLQASKAMMSVWDAALGPAISGLSAALFGAGAGAAGGNMAPSPEGGMMPVNYHEGGIVGQGGGIRRSMPASAFAMAPRFHSGLRADEFTAILERGEKVIPKGGGRGGMTINVQSPDVTATQRWLFQNRHALADMMGSAGRENNKIRRSQG